MTMDTEQFIGSLVADLKPVRRLPPSPLRCLLWLAVASPVVAVVVAVMGPRPDLMAKLGESRFLLQELAALATAIAAGNAALALGVPGTARWKLVLPFFPMLLWIGSLGHQCWMEIVHLGPGGIEFEPDAICIPGIAAISAVPAIAILAMMRRGARFHPRLTTLFGALAAAALGDAGLRLFHDRDAALMVLVWQIGSVALFSAALGLLGVRLVPDPRTGRPSETT